jgi:uncharacterized protein
VRTNIGHRPFVVPVAKLRRDIGSSVHVVRRAVIEDLACVGAEVPAGAESEADVTLSSLLGGVEVTGTVSAPWAGQCRRCLEPVSGTVSTTVRELYTEDGDGEETYPLHEDAVDLEELVRDAVLLELPPAPLCRPDCGGLCPRCGVNRNDEACQCTEETDPRWAALDVLRAPDEEAGPTGYPGPAPDTR